MAGLNFIQRHFDGKRLAVLALWLYAIVFGIATEANAANPWLRVISPYPASLLVCAWVFADARERRRGLCYDFDTFLFWTWPVLAPIYLVQTGGVRGFIPMIYFGLIWLAGNGLVAMVFGLISWGTAPS